LGGNPQKSGYFTGELSSNYNPIMLSGQRFFAKLETPAIVQQNLGDF
jgi:hypothetical protein